MKRWIVGLAVLGCTLVALGIACTRTRAQGQTSRFDQRQTKPLTLEGPAIHVLVTAPMPRWEIRGLVTNPRTARDHPNLAEYYRNKGRGLKVAAERYERLARAFGDRMPLDGDSHFSGGRDAFYYHVRAKECLRRAQTDGLLADLNAQAAQGEGCFTCHNFRGRGGKIAPDLAAEGARGRSEAWLIGHFKDPQAYSPASVMPALSGLTNRQLKVLATFLQYQEER